MIADISEVLLELGLSDSATDEERAIASTMLVRVEGAIRQFLGYDPVQRSHTEFLPTFQGNAVGDQGAWEVEGGMAVQRGLSIGTSDRLQLTHLPIRSVTSLHIDYDGRSGAASGAFAASTLKVEGVDYWPNYDGVDDAGAKLCRDGIVMSLGLWPTTPGTIKVVYVAGYSAAELHGQDSTVDASPILESVIYETVRRVRRFFATKKSSAGFLAGTLASESMGDYSYSVDGASASQLLGSGDLTPETKEKLSGFCRMGYDL